MLCILKQSPFSFQNTPKPENNLYILISNHLQPVILALSLWNSRGLERSDCLTGWLGVADVRWLVMGEQPLERRPGDARAAAVHRRVTGCAQWSERVRLCVCWDPLRGPGVVLVPTAEQDSDHWSVYSSASVF